MEPFCLQLQLELADLFITLVVHGLVQELLVLRFFQPSFPFLKTALRKEVTLNGSKSRMTSDSFYLFNGGNHGF